MGVAGPTVAQHEVFFIFSCSCFMFIFSCSCSCSLYIDNSYFEQMVGQLNQLNQSHSSGTEAPRLNVDVSITNGIVSSKIYDKWDYFNFESIYPIS